MTTKLKVINLFATCGAGKSTIAAGLFHHMKIHGYSVELISEYAKQMVWEQRNTNHFKNQAYITSKQHNKQLHLSNHDIDFCITDSPLPLSLVYTPEDYFPSFTPLVWEMYNSYDNYNVVLIPSHDYQVVGRNQTVEESKAVQDKMLELLTINNVPYKIYNTHFYSHLDIFADVYTKWVQNGDNK